MKKFKRNDLRLEKEVISALTETDLTGLRGGQGVEPRSDMWVTKDIECRTRNAGCQSQNTCYIESVDVCVQTWRCLDTKLQCAIQPVQTLQGVC